MKLVKDRYMHMHNSVQYTAHVRPDLSEEVPALYSFMYMYNIGLYIRVSPIIIPACIQHVSSGDHVH